MRIARLQFGLSSKFPDEVSEAWRDITNISPSVIWVLAKHLLSDIGQIQYVSEALRAKINQQRGVVVRVSGSSSRDIRGFTPSKSGCGLQ